MKHDIAVVMATYKRPHLLERCLECLARQKLDPARYEIIVISDGPDQATTAVVEKFRSVHPHLSVKHDNTPFNEGPASARNMGWKLADSSWIAFTDDDCLPDPYWLTAFLKTASSSTGSLVMTGRVIVPHSDVPTDYEKNIAALETADFVTANCCCSRELLELVGGFDTEYKTAWREDSDLHFRILQHSRPIEKVESAIVVHPVRKAGWGVSLREQRKSMYNALLF
ncbi:MAG: glycosyltransferase family 2 protein, partial [Sphingobacteriales bacterium]